MTINFTLCLTLPLLDDDDGFGKEKIFFCCGISLSTAQQHTHSIQYTRRSMKLGVSWYSVLTTYIYENALSLRLPSQVLLLFLLILDSVFFLFAPLLLCISHCKVKRVFFLGSRLTRVHSVNCLMYYFRFSFFSFTYFQFEVLSTSRVVFLTQLLSLFLQFLKDVKPHWVPFSFTVLCSTVKCAISMFHEFTQCLNSILLQIY